MTASVNWRALQLRLGALYEGRPDNAPGRYVYAGLFAAAAGRMSAAARELGDTAATAFPRYDCTTFRRIAFAVAEVAHETGNYTAWEEDLRRYTPANILANWGPGKGGRVRTLAEARALVAAGPEAIANKVYARPAYGNVNPGDGWRYRGRGANMQTFRCNYEAAERHTGIPFVARPELMAQPGPSLLVACYYWQARSCWAPADAADPTAWRAITNGGAIGLPDFAARARRLLALAA